MSSTSTMATAPDPIRREADRLERADETGGRFQRRRLNPGGEALVAAAVRRAQTGDEDALRFLYLRFSGNVYGYVASIVTDLHDAEDVTQQIFAKLLVTLPKYEGRDVPFSAWILRIAHNAAIDCVRARRSTPVAEVRSPELEDLDVSRERGRDLREALATLPDDQRDVIVLRFVGGFDAREVALRIGRSEMAVHGLQHRGRRALQSELTRLQAAPAAAN